MTDNYSYVITSSVDYVPVQTGHASLCQQAMAKQMSRADGTHVYLCIFQHNVSVSKYRKNIYLFTRRRHVLHTYTLSNISSYTQMWVNAEHVVQQSTAPSIAIYRTPNETRGRIPFTWIMISGVKGRIHIWSRRTHARTHVRTHAPLGG